MIQETVPKRQQIPTAALSLILLLTAALRLFRIGRQSLWADEGNSAALAARTLSEITAAAAADIHPPFYYWLLHLWTRVFGDSEAALRSLSALLGVILVWLIYLIGSRLHSRRTGLVAALLAAFNPFLIYYSQEARMYALLATLAALLFYALVRFILHESVILPVDGSGKTISFSAPATVLIVAASLAGLYTHYTFPIVLGSATLLYLLWVYNSRRRGFVQIRLLHWGLLLIVMLFLFLPQLPTALAQVRAWPRAAAPYPANQALTETLHLLAQGMVAQVRPNSPWMAVFPILFALGLWPWVRPNRRRAHWLSWGLPLLWLAAPILLMLAAGLYKAAYLKFLLVSVAPFCLLMARGATGFAEALARERRRPGQSRPGSRRPAPARAQSKQPSAPQRRPIGLWLGRLWMAAVILLAAAPSASTLRAYYFDPAAARDDYRGMAAYIEATEHPEDAIILNAPGQAEAFDYYYRRQLPVYGLPEQRPPDKEAVIARLEQIVGQHRRLYSLFWATDESDPERIVEGWLDAHAYKATDTWQGSVRFVIYATRQPTAEWPIETSNAELGDQVRLFSYALSSRSITSGDILPLQLVWQAEQTPQTDYTVFVQLLDERNQVVAQRDAPPSSGGGPTSEWQPGEQIVDNHGLLIPPATAPIDYRLIVGLYDSQTGQRLSAGAADYLALGSVRVERPETPPLPDALKMRYQDSFTFDEVTLLGHDRYKRGFGHAPDTPLAANDSLHMTFYWQANVKPTVAWQFTARLVQGADQETASVSGPLVGELYPTLNWQANEIVRGEHDLLLPDYLQPGRYQLQLFLSTGNPETAVDRVNLGTVVVGE